MNAHVPSPQPGKITALRFQQRDAERVNVFIDDHFALGLPAIVAARLKVGQSVSAEEIVQLQNLDLEERSYEKALRFLSYRPRSLAEMRRYLRGKQVDDAVAEQLLTRLTDAGYLDDVAFAQWWVENRKEFSPRGAFALRSELRLKGVAESTIMEVLETLQPENETSMEALARKRAGRLIGEVPATFRRKLGSFLLRRGFSYQEVTPLVERLWDEMGSMSTGTTGARADEQDNQLI
jgi:regulatory protein